MYREQYGEYAYWCSVVKALSKPSQEKAARELAHHECTPLADFSPARGPCSWPQTYSWVKKRPTEAIIMTAYSWLISSTALRWCLSWLKVNAILLNPQYTTLWSSGLDLGYILYDVKYAMSKRICNSFEEPAVYTLYFVTINNDNQNASWRKNIYWSERT